MVIYQIYPRSFGEPDSRSTTPGIGDLKGITRHLPYLKDLGVEAVWISPFFKSPMKDFGYDVSDYRAVDPIFGNLGDFDALMASARENGLQIMIDLVLSHSSDQHPWFTESRSSRENPKADWYVWADADAVGGPPNNWMSLFGGRAWQWDEPRQQYYLHNFLKEQPDFNFHQPAVRQALLDACEFWFKKGVRGLRLDVCNFYFHSAGLENNPSRTSESADTEGVHAGNPYNSQKHVFDKDRPENVAFLNDLRALADRYPGTILMGEVVSDDSFAVMRDYVGGGGPLHTAYNFSLFKHGFNANEMANVLREVEAKLPNGVPTWALGNHDVPRFVSRFRAGEAWREGAKCFLLFLFSLRGHVILYQGDELGLDEAEIPFELMQDPFGIAFYPEFKGRDGCRTPFPWTTENPFEKSWLPVPDSHLQRSTATQVQDAQSVLSFTRQLVSWRRARPWLDTAPIEILGSTDAVLSLRRRVADHELITVINGSDEKQSIEIETLGRIDLGPYEFRVWENSCPFRL